MAWLIWLFGLNLSPVILAHIKLKSQKVCVNREDVGLGKLYFGYEGGGKEEEMKAGCEAEKKRD